MSDIINPYIAGNPVTGTQMFFGREDIFRFIRQTLIGEHRDNVIVLYGQRRTGKTSVLYQLRHHLDPRYLCIFIDLHGFALEGLGGFLWELANHIIRVLRRNYQIDLPSLKRTAFMADARSSFESEFLHHVWSVIGDRHILLMLDEAVRLEEQVQAGKLEREIFEYVRHLMQHYEWLNFLFSLGSGLEEMEKEYAFLFNVGLYKEISFLERDAAISLITQPVEKYYRVEPAAVERILQITSGHPYYTQLICHSLFNRWQQENSLQVEVRDVDESLDEVVERGLAVLKHVWDESTMGEKAVLAGMATAMGEQNCLIGTKAINRAWTTCNVVIPKGELAQATRSLIARDVIAGQDEYMFTVDLQRLWVRKYKRIASGSRDMSVLTWDATTGKNPFRYIGHTNWVYAVAWSPDGKRIASGSRDKTVQVWEAATGNTIFTYGNHSDWVYAVAWSPDGKRIASADFDKTVRVWDAVGGGHVLIYRGHSEGVSAVAWSPNGRRIASGSQDATVQIWDALSGGDVITYKGHVALVWQVAWSPNGKLIASASRDATVQVWEPR